MLPEDTRRRHREGAERARPDLLFDPAILHQLADEVRDAQSESERLCVYDKLCALAEDYALVPLSHGVLAKALAAARASPGDWRAWMRSRRDAATILRDDAWATRNQTLFQQMNGKIAAYNECLGDPS